MNYNKNYYTRDGYLTITAFREGYTERYSDSGYKVTFDNESFLSLYKNKKKFHVYGTVKGESVSSDFSTLLDARICVKSTGLRLVK